jgi:long-chain acyl-CoA synthetase
MKLLAHEVDVLADLFHQRVIHSGATEAHRMKVDGYWQSVTWREMGQQVYGLAHSLSERGVGQGSAVAILGNTCPEWCLADLAAIVLGGRSVGIYPTLMTDQIEYILEDAKVEVLFVQGQEDLERLKPLCQQIPSLHTLIIWDHPPVKDAHILHLDTLLSSRTNCDVPKVNIHSDDVAIIVYTSGTTGRPKGVPLTNANILAHLRTGQALMPEPITETDITLVFLPMAHVAERVPSFYGRINVGLRAAYATSYETVLDELLEIRPTYFGAVPRIFEKMYGRIRERVAQTNSRRQAIFKWADALARKKTRAQLSAGPFSTLDKMMYAVADRLVYQRIRDVFGGRVKTFITGAAPINTDILEFFHGVGMTILEVYGLSESTAIAFANQPGQIRHGTVGKALPGVEFRLGDDGEVCLRGEIIFGGYLNLEDDDVFDEDGYFRTGDIGVVDTDGYLRLTDRKKNLLKTAGGKYVAPARLESLIKEEPLVSQVYIHGDRQKYVVALVTLDEAEAQRIAKALGTDMAKLPTHPIVVLRINRAMEGANARLARFEQIKAHGILEEDFSIEADTLTPTLKIKRRAVAKQYEARLAALYAEESNP